MDKCEGCGSPAKSWCHRDYWMKAADNIHTLQYSRDIDVCEKCDASAIAKKQEDMWRYLFIYMGGEAYIYDKKTMALAYRLPYAPLTIDGDSEEYKELMDKIGEETYHIFYYAKPKFPIAYVAFMWGFCEEPELTVREIVEVGKVKRNEKQNI